MLVERVRAVARAMSQDLAKTKQKLKEIPAAFDYVEARYGAIPDRNALTAARRKKVNELQSDLDRLQRIAVLLQQFVLQVERKLDP